MKTLLLTSVLFLSACGGGVEPFTCHVTQFAAPVHATRPIDCAAVETNAALAFEFGHGFVRMTNGVLDEPLPPIKYSLLLMGAYNRFEDSLKTLSTVWVVDTHGTEGYWGNGEQCLKWVGGQCLMGETFDSGEVDVQLGMFMFMHELGHHWSFFVYGDADQNHVHFAERGIDAAQNLYQAKKVNP